MEYYNVLPSGKIKYYWEDFENAEAFLRDPIDGIHGMRRWLLEVIPDKESILDIGCGPGHVSETFRQAGRTNGYLGIDNDIKTINLAKTLFPNAKFDCLDCFFLPYSDHSFDNCILFTVVEMISDFRKAVEEAVRVSRKRVIITTFISLTDQLDYRKYKVNEFGDYVVKINEDRFLKHLHSFGFPITSGTLQLKGKTEYWWWMISK